MIVHFWYSSVYPAYYYIHSNWIAGQQLAQGTGGEKSRSTVPGNLLLHSSLLATTIIWREIIKKNRKYGAMHLNITMLMMLDRQDRYIVYQNCGTR